MVANVITTGVQVGQSGTANNNFVLVPDGSGALRIYRGNTDALGALVLEIDANGAFTTAPVLGVGQTWQNVTGSRALSVTYTNTTTKPIQVAVSLSTTSTVNSSAITVNGVAVDSAGVTQTSSTHNHFVIVPVGATYSVSATSATIIAWTELR